MSDSKSRIEFTDGEVVQLSSKPIDNFYLDEKTRLKWANEKYMCLRHSNGSDTWTDIVLSFDNNNFKLIDNSLIYDKINGVVICETDSANYKLFAESINSGRKQYFGNDWADCSSVFPHYCIDSINLSDKDLYLEWVLPNKTEKSTRKQIKKIRLNL
ncbi:MAG: hypothetical protein E2590_05395 [Chryseobacterium sp.]|nr:hypothetical protein [Chryseobacterium sp.]